MIEWKTISMLQNRYEASDCGMIRKVSPQPDRKALAVRYKRNGQPVVKVFENKKNVEYPIPLLVLNAFRGFSGDARHIFHHNRLDHDCSAENLFVDAEAYEAQLSNRHNAIEECRVNQYNLNGIFMQTWDNTLDLKRSLNYSQSVLRRCCNAKLETRQCVDVTRNVAYGYKWKWHKDCLD